MCDLVADGVSVELTTKMAARGMCGPLFALAALGRSPVVGPGGAAQRTLLAAVRVESLDDVGDREVADSDGRLVVASLGALKLLASCDELGGGVLARNGGERRVYDRRAGGVAGPDGAEDGDAGLAGGGEVEALVGDGEVD